MAASSGLLAVLHGATLGLAVLILLSNLDDLVIDLIALGRQIYRRTVIFRRHRPLAVATLYQPAEQAIAIMIPAWHESAVIARMLETAAATYDYANYRLFVGTYVNDAETGAAVGQAAANLKRVTPVLVPHPGPTNKADCLNAIYAGIARYEAENGIRFAMFVMHDAEDVVHPLELKLFNYLVPRKDMVQLPVVALERGLWDFTGGHYMDEFAESHAKELLAREWLTASVPSAGVGCAFSRRAMAAVAARRGGAPFNTASLTEDYDFALTLTALGFSQIFVRFDVWRRANEMAPMLIRRRAEVRDLVATREYFPNRLRDAYRQKARWLIGIVFQGAAAQGWRGPWPLKYVLFRDRKGVFTAFLGVAAYALAGAWALLFLLGGYAPLVGQPVLKDLLIANGLLLFNRSLHRAFFVSTLYGWRQALVSVPRQVWGNLINFLAACRAIALFADHRWRGTPLAWDKTRHAFPTEAELRPFRDRLGARLIEKGALQPRTLKRALQAQRRRGGVLGALLASDYQIDERAIYEALAEQLGLPFRDLVPVSPIGLRHLPLPVALKYRIVPLGLAADGVLEVAAAHRLPATDESKILAAATVPIRWVLALPSAIEQALAAWPMNVQAG